MWDSPPVDAPLNLLAQSIFTWASWGLAFVVCGVAIRLWITEKTPFYLLLMLASTFAAFAEPLYDVGMMLWFHEPGIWSHFSAFGVPQPIWTHSGYAILYGATALLICQRLHQRRLNRSGFFVLAGITFVMSCAFEIIAINSGLYQYWGPHVLRLFGYPLVVPVLETAQVVCFAVAAAQFRARTSHPAALLALFVIFPAAFYLANFGAGAPVIIALHLDPQPSAALIWIGTLLSISAGLALIRLAGDFVAVGARGAGIAERTSAAAL